VGVLTIPSDAKSVLLNRLPEVLQLLELPTPLALLCAVVVAGSIAAVFGLAVMRLRGIAAGILTLSFLVVVYETLTNWRVLGSSGTITRIPYETTPFVAAVVACAAIVVAWLFQNSKTGLSLRAARDEENAARAMGVNVTSVRLVAFVLSAAIMAVGGGLSAQLTSTISPGAFFLNLTFLTIGMLVVGGMHRLSGAVLGALVISVVNEGLRQFEAFLANAGMPVFGLRDLALAVAIVLILMFRTEGLVGSTEFKIRLGKKNAKPTGGKQE
jgi:branched-chain amino acid transport system permease protein